MILARTIQESPVASPDLKAIAGVLGPRILDVRPSTPSLRAALIEGLAATGCHVADLGTVPTPVAYFAARRHRPDGLAIVTASHNPQEWNALKFFGSDGIYLDAEEGKQLLDIYYQGDFFNAKWNQLKTVESYNSASEEHIKRVLSSIDGNAIRKRKFKVL